MTEPLLYYSLPHPPSHLKGEVAEASLKAKECDLWTLLRILMKTIV